MLRWLGCSSRTQFRWFGEKLELTTTLEELPDFAPWVVAWAKAKYEGLPFEFEPPHPFERGWGRADPLANDYLWTQAGADEYQNHRHAKSLNPRNQSAGVSGN
jgi:hypothetical protein